MAREDKECLSGATANSKQENFLCHFSVFSDRSKIKLVFDDLVQIKLIVVCISVLNIIANSKLPT